MASTLFDLAMTSSPAPHPRSAPTLETERLRLRHYCKSDFSAHRAILSDEAVQRQLGVRGLNREENWRRFAASVGMWQLVGFGAWAVVRKADDRLVGVVSLFNAWRDLVPEFGEQPEMGWIFDTSVHGQGVAREACEAALDWLDATHGPVEVPAIIAIDNVASLNWRTS